ncbi:MAG: pentapeptide repeat-containing protein [Myxococcota bacterium]
MTPPLPQAPHTLRSSDDPVTMLRRWSRSDDRAAAEAAVGQMTAHYIKDTGRGLPLEGVDLSGLDLRNFDLRAANFNRAALHGAILDNADLTGASLICTGLERASLRGARLRHAYVHSLAAQVTNFDGADLTGWADSTGALFHGCSMIDAKLTDSMLSGSTFYQCTLVRCDFTGARLQGSTINECQASHASFRDSQVDELTVTKTDLQGASFEGAKGEGLVLQRLTGAESLTLAHAKLPGLCLRHIRAPLLNLTATDASGGTFSDIWAPGLVAGGAQFSGANIQRCTWPQAKLRRASMDHASLRHVTLDEGDLRNINAENATMTECRFVDADMSGIAGRCLTWRDCESSSVDLADAYLYRAMITGDPPRTMALNGARLQRAVLVQSYIAASLQHADLTLAHMAYARLNQSDLTGAKLEGISIYGGSLIKADMTDSSVNGLRGPAFVDRCRGLSDELARSKDPETERFANFIELLTSLLQQQRRGST